MHSGGAVHGVPDLSGRERAGAAGVYYGGVWTAREASDREEYEKEVVFWYVYSPFFDTLGKTGLWLITWLVDSFGKPRMIVSSKGKRRRPSSKTLQYALKCDDDAFIDFITRCLRWDPEKRLKPDEAMHHDFITGRKSSSRPRTANESPVKRFAPSYSTSVSRPLPDPPASKPRLTQAMQNTSASSPMKTFAVKRNPSTAGTGTKRNSMGAVIGQGSGLPRVAAQRSVSGKVPTPSSSSNGLRGGAGTASSIRLVRDDESSMSESTVVHTKGRR